jgi:threonine dehydratase
VSLEDIREAARGIAGVAVRTSLVRLPGLSDHAGVPVYLKLESEQPTGAFKLRGAWTFVRRLPEEARARGVITYSSGNHGQAVAFAAQRVGVRAVVVMPETAPATKIDGVKRWGGEVLFAGTTSEDRYERAMEIVPDVTHVAVPVGGGGLIAGITTAVKALRPETRVTGVEPEGGACLGAALAAGQPVRLEKTASIADGLLPLSVGTLTFRHLKGLVDAVTVSDRAIAEATVWLNTEQELTVEPSGAATTAALRAGTLQPNGPCVLVVSGGNVDAETVAALARS